MWLVKRKEELYCSNGTLSVMGNLLLKNTFNLFFKWKTQHNITMYSLILRYGREETEKEGYSPVILSLHRYIPMQIHTLGVMLPPQHPELRNFKKALTLEAACTFPHGFKCSVRGYIPRQKHLLKWR